MGASSEWGAAEAAAIGPLTAFAAAVARGRLEPARRALVAVRRAGAGRVAAEEVALMLVLHAGYPAALEGARLLLEALLGRGRRRREDGPPAGGRRGERPGAGGDAPAPP